jgi:hypothetical protein
MKEERYMEMRRQHRIFHRAKMRLKATDRDESVIARVQNLSPLGVFVTAPGTELPEPGTEVECGFSFAGEPRTVRGRVAWRRPLSPATPLASAGVGIEFVDIADRDAEVLRRIVGRRSGETLPVDVWFEGMDGAATRCQGTVAGAGLRLDTRLPFMRLHSTVRLVPADRPGAEVREGVIESVTVEHGEEDGVPHLLIGVSLPPVETARGTIETPAVSPTPQPAGEHLSLVVDPALMSAVPATSDPTAVDPHLLDQMSPGQMSPSMAASTALPLAEPPTSRMGVGRWLTSGWRPAVLGCAAGALLVAAATWRPRSVPAAQQVPIAVVEHAPPPPARPAGARIEPLQAAGAEGLPLQLQNDGPRARLRMPLAGKSKGAQQRRLSDPPGIGVTLPQARPFIPAGVYNAANGPLRVEVQRRGAGSEVLFLYDPRTHGASVNVDGDAILVELTTKN